VSAASDADAETTDADRWSRRPLLSTGPVEPALDLDGIEAKQPPPLQVRDPAFRHKPAYVTIVHTEPSGDRRQVKQWLMRMRSCGHCRPPWSMAAYLGHRDAHFIAALAEIVGHDPSYEQPNRGRPAERSGTLGSMATQVNLDPELQSTVERARKQASERGELLDGPAAPFSADLSPAARAALADWVTSGDYDRAVAEITAGDPDLATQ
jgi:hypothetical protein